MVEPPPQPDKSLLALWAKMGDGKAGYHPLLCHALDAAAVAAVLWDSRIASSIKKRIAAEWGVPVDVARSWAMFAASIHDLGKATPTFQFQLPVPALAAAHQLPQSLTQTRVPHGAASQALAERFVTELGWLDRAAARPIAQAIGAHHGTFAQPGDLESASFRAALGGRPWSDVQRQLCEHLAKSCRLEGVRLKGGTAYSVVLLAGLISVSDWIASSRDDFPFAADRLQPPTVDLAMYADQAHHMALRAIARTGWTPRPEAGRPQSIRELFPTIVAARPLQSAAERLAQTPMGQAMVILEAPMGEGKTEAAMLLAEVLTSDVGYAGTYFALPTQATSNQMFRRIVTLLNTRFPDAPVSVGLHHCHASLSADLEALRRDTQRPFRAAGVCDEDGDAGAIASGWFLNRRRGLLAPYGVGTLDQALMGGLRVKHGFVRLFALAAKVVVIDEVHAYDTYTTDLLMRLVEWLGGLGASIVMLSATLPARRRQALLEAFGRSAGTRATVPHPPVAYPRLTVVSTLGAHSEHLDAAPRSCRQLRIEHCGPWSPEAAPTGLADAVAASVEGGGCVAVICNTVGRAQRAYRAIAERMGDHDVMLLHARFPWRERARREAVVTEHFGPPSSQRVRPTRMVLVATQVVEQSLDVDFDGMFTDLAPIDLILQRAGRIHRHEGRGRPSSLRDPTLNVLQPRLDEDGTPAFDRADEFVYNRHLLLKTWWELRNRRSIAIPSDIEVLVEAVYDDHAPPPDASIRDKWIESRDALRRAQEAERAEARVRRVGPPLPDEPVYHTFGSPRAEDAPDLHPRLQALTRLIEPTVPVVLLWAAERNPLLEPAGDSVNLTTEPDRETTIALLERSVTLTHPAIVRLLFDAEVPRGWRRSPHLCHHRPVILDVTGEAHIGRYRLRLDTATGVEIVSPDR